MEMATNDGSSWTAADFGMPSWMGDMIFSHNPPDAEDMMEHNHAFFTNSSPRLLEDLNSRVPIDSDSFMLDEFDPIYDEGMELNEGAPKFITAATQTPGQINRKIKPVKHPGLVLKTPIAYEKDTDLNVIPITKDGMAVCEQCGAMGVRHAFYTKERRFCSQACARQFAEREKSNFEALAPLMNLYPPEEKKARPSDSKRRSKHDPSAPHPIEVKRKMGLDADTLSFLGELSDKEKVLGRKSRKGKVSEASSSYDWKESLGSASFNAAPVTCFRHAPCVRFWDDVSKGIKVEVENTDVDNSGQAFSSSFWVATVMQISGYYALLRYEGFGVDSSKDFWVNMCCGELEPVGKCATQGKPLIPPKSVENKYSDWKTFLHQRLTGARTLPSNFYQKVLESQVSRFRPGMILEVVDKLRISQMKVASIVEIVGKRLHVKYLDTDDDGFWCHEDSPLLHPVGWAKQVGASIHAPCDYLERCNTLIYEPDDATGVFFRDSGEPNYYLPPDCQFTIGMKLEAIDPLNLSSICVATVMQVLEEDYIMIRIDSYDEDPSNSDWFCYHASSPCIFPAGFCAVNNIPLTPPKGYLAETFTWQSYLAETGLETAPLAYFTRAIPQHGFQAGMHVEAADLMDPRLVCTATISRVVGRLLKVHFDGWEEEFDQWLDCESPDIYPIGWCVLVKHRLEGPPQQPQADEKKFKPKKRPRKRQKKTKSSPSILADLNPVPAQPPSLNVRDPCDSAYGDQVIKKPMANATRFPLGIPSMQSAGFRVPDSATNGVYDLIEIKEEPLMLVEQSSLPELPKERVVTSYINNMGTNNKLIPRLIDATGSNSEPGELIPSKWNVFDVAQFLRVNDCATYCDSFNRRKIDGSALLSLTKDQIIDLTGMKVGPSLKIFDLIQQLKSKTNPFGDRLKGLRFFRSAD